MKQPRDGDPGNDAHERVHARDLVSKATVDVDTILGAEVYSAFSAFIYGTLAPGWRTQTLGSGMRGTAG